MPSVLITPEAFIHKSGPYVNLLEEAGFEIAYPRDTTFTRGLCSEEETIEQLRPYGAVLAGGEWFTPRILENLPQLRVIARCGVGYDRVDVPSATRHGVVVTITPTANFDAVAEQTLALLFAVAKSVVVFDRGVRDNSWQRELTEPIRGSTLGIVGLGRIGRAFALRAKALGMRVLAHEMQPDELFVREHGIQLLSLDDVLAQADYLSIHCPLNDETEGMFNKSVFAKMKPGSVLLNTARGKLVVEEDLVDALRSGHLRAAGLDVYEEEPPQPDNPLLQLDNVVLSPHVSGEDRLSSENMGIEAAQCIVQLRAGEWPDGAVVNDQLREGWNW